MSEAYLWKELTHKAQNSQSLPVELKVLVDSNLKTNRILIASSRSGGKLGLKVGDEVIVAGQDEPQRSRRGQISNVNSDGTFAVVYEDKLTDNSVKDEVISTPFRLDMTMGEYCLLLCMCRFALVYVHELAEVVNNDMHVPISFFRLGHFQFVDTNLLSRVVLHQVFNFCTFFLWKLWFATFLTCIAFVTEVRYLFQIDGCIRIYLFKTLHCLVWGEM